MDSSTPTKRLTLMILYVLMQESQHPSNGPTVPKTDRAQLLCANGLRAGLLCPGPKWKLYQRL